MTNKEKAIEGLRSIAHWIETSKFDYDKRGLTHVLNMVVKDYTEYLKEKNGNNK